MPISSNTTFPLGSTALDFLLPDVENHLISLSNIKMHHGFLLVIGCNHCPYVKHVLKFLPELQDRLDELDIGMVMISSNDINTHPEDGPEQMAILSDNHGFEFPYLFDETQQVAKDYNAVCTPDFYLFDGNNALYYHGQLDDSRPNNDIEVTGEDLLDAALKMSNAMSAPENQKASVGCGIKWK